MSCANSPEKLCEDGAVDRDPALFHPRQDVDHRTLQRLIDIGHVLGGKARLQHVPETQGDVGVLRRIFGRLVDGDAGKADKSAARASHLAELDWLMAKMLFAEHVHSVIRAARVEHIGQKHGVIDRPHRDAALLEK